MDYYQGYEDATRKARVTHSYGIIGFLIRAIITSLYSAFVYVPLLLLSYVLVSKVSTLYSNDVFVKIGLTIIIAYLLFSIVYFLKGILIGARCRGRRWWAFIWMFCIVITCGIQALMGQTLLQQFLETRHVANFQVWSWVGAGIIIIFIYSHYQFLTNIAPRSVFWSYQIGFSIAHCTSKKELNSAPNKSDSYFQNTPMKVSYKKDCNIPVPFSNHYN